MRIGSGEVVWAAELLTCLPSVEVLSLRVDAGWLTCGGGSSRSVSVPMLELRVHACGWDHASRLADALGLQELDPRIDPPRDGGFLQWRSWQGWVAEGSREAACRVEVVASRWAAAVNERPDDVGEVAS